MTIQKSQRLFDKLANCIFPTLICIKKTVNDAGRVLVLSIQDSFWLQKLGTTTKSITPDSLQKGFLKYVKHKIWVLAS